MFGATTLDSRKSTCVETVIYKANEGTIYFEWHDQHTKGTTQKTKRLTVLTWQVYPYMITGMQFYLKGKNINSLLYFCCHQSFLSKDIINYLMKLLIQQTYEEALYISHHYNPISKNVIIAKEMYCTCCKQQYSYYESVVDHSRTACQQILFILQVLKQLK